MVWSPHAWWPGQPASFGGGPGWGARGARGAGPGGAPPWPPTKAGQATMYVGSPTMDSMVSMESISLFRLID